MATNLKLKIRMCRIELGAVIFEFTTESAAFVVELAFMKRICSH